jgi:hypothetical protein
MDDSETVDTSLDDFERDFFQIEAKAEVVEEATEQEEEVSETPSATENVEESEVETVEVEDEQDDAPEDETEEEVLEEEEVEETKPEPKKRKPARERINELTREKRELERRLLALEEASRKPEPVKEPEQKTNAPAVEGPSPDALDADGEPLYPLGEFDPNYIQALVKHLTAQERAEAERARIEQERMTAAEKAEQELNQTWNTKVQESLERLPDLPEKVADLESSFRDLDPEYGNFLASTIMSLDNGPDVLNYLADNVEEAQRLAASGPTRAIVALGKLDARFERVSTEKVEVEKGKKVKLTSAPAPAPKNKGSGSAKPVDLSDLETFEKEFFN